MIERDLSYYHSRILDSSERPAQTRRLLKQAASSVRHYFPSGDFYFVGQRVRKPGVWVNPATTLQEGWAVVLTPEGLFQVGYTDYRDSNGALRLIPNMTIQNIASTKVVEKYGYLAIDALGKVISKDQSAAP